MSRPNLPKINLPFTSKFEMTQPFNAVTLNEQIFEQMINEHGVKMLHSRPIPCPNVRDVNSPEHNPACNFCFNGFLYYGGTEFIGCSFSNTLERRFNQNGTWDLDQAMFIIPTFDLKGVPLDVQFFDQISVPGEPVRYYQRVEHSQSGIDRLQFPAISVDKLVDSSLKEYRPDVDFIVDGGRIKWIGERPGYNSTLGKGVIYGVNYYTLPVYTIIGLPHHLRVSQTKGGDNGQNTQKRFPQLAVVRKDFIPFDSADRIGAPDRPEPEDGSFK